MTFNAKINIARSFDTFSEGPVQIEEELKKMLKDAKNNEFLTLYILFSGVVPSTK